MQHRVTGFDLARALAIFGMVIVNFKIAMSANTGFPLLLNFASLFEGRASALFVILAGVGVTFLTNKARTTPDSEIVFENRISLLKRGLLLVGIGLIYTPVWEADILHFYGIYFLIASTLFMASDKTLLLSSFIIMLAFPILMLFFDYEKNWDWVSLTYNNFWSMDGMLRSITFNGFHPVFPWSSFLIFGMWLGRQNLSQKWIRNRLLVWSFTTLIITESSFYFLRALFEDGTSLGMTKEEVTFLFSTSLIPPLPQYIISAGSSAVIALISCLYLAEKYSKSHLNKWLQNTGKLSLTLYVAHVIVGMGFLESIGRLENQTINFSLFSAFLFCFCGVCFSTIWLKYFKVGPLEWIFRKVAS